jgi:hypothetical protein
MRILGMKLPDSQMDGDITMKKGFLLTLLLVFGLSACAPSGGGQAAFRLTAQAAGAFAATGLPSATPLPTETQTPLPPTETAIPVPSLTPTSSFFPQLTFAQSAVCHTGPGTRYNRTGTVIAQGKVYPANGRSRDGAWIIVQAPAMGDDCWIQLTSLVAPGDLSALRVVDAQPLPDSPINLITNSFACGFKKRLRLTWYAVYGMGYHIYRSGTPIGTVYDGEFVDLNTPQSALPTDYLYSVEAFNASGVSLPNTITVTLCN